MVTETLPCAEKRCSSKMSLVENKDNIIYYRCLEKHNAHYFRYDVAQKQWERLIVTRKLVLHFEVDPCRESLLESAPENSETCDFEIEESVVDEFEDSLVAPIEAPIEMPPEAPVDVSAECELVAEEVDEKAEIESDLMTIKGIGSKQVEELGLVGVHTISDLAKCSASSLSEKTGLPTSKLLSWIVKAKTMTEEQEMIPA